MTKRDDYSDDYSVYTPLSKNEQKREQNKSMETTFVHLSFE